MNRFQFVLDSAEQLSALALPTLATQFNDAVATVLAEGDEPAADPAVLVLGAWIAFHTHADVNTVHGYNKLLGICRERLDECPLDS